MEGAGEESAEVFRQGSYSRICLVSLEEGEGDLMRNWRVQAGKDNTNDDSQMQCSDGEPIHVLVMIQSCECFLWTV